MVVKFGSMTKPLSCLARAKCRNFRRPELNAVAEETNDHSLQFKGGGVKVGNESESVMAMK
jgi:hypothetical protein